METSDELNSNLTSSSSSVTSKSFVTSTTTTTPTRMMMMINWPLAKLGHNWSHEQICCQLNCSNEDGSRRKKCRKKYSSSSLVKCRSVQFKNWAGKFRPILQIVPYWIALLLLLLNSLPFRQSNASDLDSGRDEFGDDIRPIGKDQNFIKHFQPENTSLVHLHFHCLPPPLPNDIHIFTLET